VTTTDRKPPPIIADHEHRVAIEQMIADGVSSRAIAREYGVSHQSVNTYALALAAEHAAELADAPPRQYVDVVGEPACAFMNLWDRCTFEGPEQPFAAFWLLSRFHSTIGTQRGTIGNLSPDVVASAVRNTRRRFPEWEGLDGDGPDVIARLRLTFDVAQARWASRQAG